MAPPSTSKLEDDVSVAFRNPSHHSNCAAELDNKHVNDQDDYKPERDARVWLIFLALSVSAFLTPLELTSVSTALPTILNDLHGTDFVWIATAYTLASTAVLPMTGGLAEIFGRRPAMLASLSLFGLGSALCGAAQNVPWLIAARAVQGMGGGSMASLTNIIIADLIPLKDRGLISGVLALLWAVAAALGPVVGGALTARPGQWRWLFYLNVPIVGVAFVLVLILLNVRAPTGTFSEKMRRMDWIGNFLVVASSSACVIAITWGGVTYPWQSPRVLVPLILGLLGLVLFLFYEARFAREPIVPFSLVTNRTSFSGYLQTFICPFLTLGVIYYMPTYFQACKLASPVRSGIDLLGFCITLGPAGVLGGVSVSRLNGYRVQAWVGWTLLIIAMGLLSTINEDSSLAKTVAYPALVGVGGGIVYAVASFPVLAPLPVKESAHALAFFSFCRAFAGVWGVAIGGTILQNELSRRLPPSFAESFPGGVALAYATIPKVASLSEPARDAVRAAFAQSIAVIWRVMIAVAVLGLAVSLMMKAVPMHAQTDENWGLEKSRDGELEGREGTEEGSDEKRIEKESIEAVI
ncbi:MFS general substrate transporter [Obba rivulosa]|uniref:MFS general substrate transporter n=1 Tax=Obba rivulosa TaxID=1052685 RepID=A0A8E2DJ71_9APHY|nr:MFS general substrate transporter [Obba rivulosa]